MKKYISSFKLCNNPKQLLNLFWENKKIAFISNARDVYPNSLDRLSREQINIDELLDIWLNIEKMDLKKYFWKKWELGEKLKEFWWVFVVGGNTFVLRQAYQLSGFDEIILDYEENNHNFVYAWYSAWVCLLWQTLDGYHLVDDPDIYPYDDIKRTIWSWLWILKYSIAPHYKSNHPESEQINTMIDYFIENKILFKTLKDGESLIYN